MSDFRTARLARIHRAAGLVEVRMRLARALAALPSALTLSLAAAAIVLAVRKTLPEHLSELRARQILVGIAAGAFVWVAFALLRRLPPRAGTMALDRHHGLADRLTNALAFAARPEADRTPLMEAAIDDGCEAAAKLEARKASPIPVPRELGVTALVAAGVVLVALLEVRTPIRETPTATTIDPLAMTPDDIELFKDAAKALARDDQSPEVKAAIEQFNQLIEDIANRRLDRTEAFRRMEAIERELLQGAEAERKALEEALREAGEELAKSDLAKPVGEALKKKDLAQAKKDMRELAKRLRDKKKPDKAALERLRQALQRAVQRKKDALAAINEKRSEIKEQILKKRKQSDPDAGAPDPQEERLLKKKERELERLDREAEQRERSGRQLDRLDRELAKAAEDLLRDLGLSADDLDQAAEDINRLEEQEMSEKEKEELRQRLEELREILRQQGQGGKQRMARMLRFGKRARGGAGGQGEQGQDQEGGEDGHEGEDGRSGDGSRPGQGGQKWVIGPGGKKVLMLSKGSSAGAGSSGSGQSGGDQQGGGKGEGVGSGHDSNVAGKRTDLRAETHDVQAQGLDTKEGPTNSEVILSAAERGFRGGPYRKVYTQYHTVAEQQMSKDRVPDGYRFYVHRYFQLIRPRE